MSVRYIASGDEFKAKQILGEGRHQLSILKNLMNFQNLQQLQRTVRYNDGTEIKVSSFFGQDVINVFVPVGVPVVKEIEIPVIEEEIKIMFEFKLTRSDGVEITKESDLLLGIWLYDSEQAAIETKTEYNTATGYWEVSVVNFEDDIDFERCWAKYICKCGVETQYPGKTVEADKWKEEDFVKPNKKYEDIIPSRCFQFKVIRDEDGSLIDNSIIFAIKWEDTLGNSKWIDSRPGRGLIYDSDPVSSTYQHWVFEISTEELDPAGYWITFMSVANSIQSQYPKKVRGVEQKQLEDLLQPGTYNATVPVWILSSSSNDPTYKLIEQCILTCEEKREMGDHVRQFVWQGCGITGMITVDAYYTTQKSVTETQSVISSVPYMVSVDGLYNGEISCFGNIDEGLYSKNTCPEILSGPTCASWEIDSISLSGAGGMSVSWSKGEPMPVSDTKQFIASGSGSYDATVTVTTSDYDYLDECDDGDEHYERIVTFPFVGLKTSHPDGKISARVSISLEWNY